MISLEAAVLSRLRGCATMCYGDNGGWCVTATNVYGGAFLARGTGSVRLAFTNNSVVAFTTEAPEIDVMNLGESG